MKEGQEKYIHQYLNQELSKIEFRHAVEPEDFEDINLILDAFKQVKPQHYNVNEEFSELKGSLVFKPKRSFFKKWLYPSVAAIVILLLVSSIVFVNTFRNGNTVYLTSIGQEEKINLPDGSQVWLNAKSKVIYNEQSWKKNRVLNLEGEAYFEVAKGKQFTVNTEKGSVQVLGTKFNVNARHGAFKVDCFEGKVNVSMGTGNQLLLRGQSFYNHEQQKINQQTLIPDWVNHKSQFKSELLENVFKDIKLYHDIEFEIDSDIDLKRQFTGVYFHNDSMNNILNSILNPLNLTYTKTKNRTFKISKK